MAVARAGLLGAVLITLAAGIMPAAAQGSFPWKPGDPAPALRGIRLGDTRDQVESRFGSPASTQLLESGLLLCRYDVHGVFVAYTTEARAEVIYAHGRDATIGGVRVGQRAEEVRAEWGDQLESEGGVRFYSSGRVWLAAVRIESGVVTQLGLIGIDQASTPDPQPYVVPDGSDIFRVVAGVWDWSGADGFCSSDPHTISFTPDRRHMVLTFKKPEKEQSTGRVVRYEIRGHTRSSIRGFIEDETRRTESGELVVWDLVLMSPDEYRWHRTDWEEGGYTKGVLRCPPS